MYNEATTLLKNNISRDPHQNHAQVFTKDRQNFQRQILLGHIHPEITWHMDATSGHS